MNKNIVKVYDQVVVESDDNYLRMAKNSANLDQILKSENISEMVDILYADGIEEKEDLLKKIDNNELIGMQPSKYFALSLGCATVMAYFIMKGAPIGVISNICVYGISFIGASLVAMATSYINYKTNVGKLEDAYVKADERLHTLSDLKILNEKKKESLIEENVPITSIGEIKTTQIGGIDDLKKLKTLLDTYEESTISLDTLLELMYIDTKSEEKGYEKVK